MWIGVTLTLIGWLGVIALFFLGETWQAALLTVPALGMGTATAYEWHRRRTRC